MSLAQGPQRSDTGEARTHGPSVSTTEPLRSLKKMHVESQGLSSNSTSVLEAEPGKLDIKRHEPGILVISLQFCSLLELKIMT